METNIAGVVWRCAAQITAYQIVPQEYWAMANPEPDGATMAQHLFEGTLSADPEPVAFVPGAAQILVAGRSFGCGGKSIPHPAIAMQSAGVELVIAESVSRYCYRNMINLSLPVLICPGITAFVGTGSRLSADILSGRIVRADGAVIYAEPMPEIALKMLTSGNALRYYCG